MPYVTEDPKECSSGVVPSGLSPLPWLQAHVFLILSRFSVWKAAVCCYLSGCTKECLFFRNPLEMELAAPTG